LSNKYVSVFLSILSLFVLYIINASYTNVLPSLLSQENIFAVKVYQFLQIQPIDQYITY